MSNYVGVSVAKDLACIAVVGRPADFCPTLYLFEGDDFIGKPPQQVAVRGSEESISLLYHIMFTYTDGRAFRAVPHFNRWRPEFCLHDNSIEDVEFGRALGDVCDKYCTQIVGYDPAQTKLLSRRSLPIEKDSPYMLEALRKLNRQVRSNDSGAGNFGPDNSAIQYMWESLPTERVTVNERGFLHPIEVTERVFPHGELLPRGRYDFIRAVCNAIAVQLMVERNDVPWLAEEKAEDERRDVLRLEEAAAQAVIDKQRCREAEEYWESVPPEASVVVEVLQPGMKSTVSMVMSMEQALPLLKSEHARFVRMNFGWERYAWRGFKQ